MEIFEESKLPDYVNTDLINNILIETRKQIYNI